MIHNWIPGHAEREGLRSDLPFEYATVRYSPGREGSLQEHGHPPSLSLASCGQFSTVHAKPDSTSLTLSLSLRQFLPLILLLQAPFRISYHTQLHHPLRHGLSMDRSCFR